MNENLMAIDPSEKNIPLYRVAEHIAAIYGASSAPIVEVRSSDAHRPLDEDGLVPIELGYDDATKAIWGKALAELVEETRSSDGLKVSGYHEHEIEPKCIPSCDGPTAAHNPFSDDFDLERAPNEVNRHWIPESAEI